MYVIRRKVILTDCIRRMFSSFHTCVSVHTREGVDWYPSIWVPGPYLTSGPMSFLRGTIVYDPMSFPGGTQARTAPLPHLGLLYPSGASGVRSPRTGQAMDRIRCSRYESCVLTGLFCFSRVCDTVHYAIMYSNVSHHTLG